MKQLLKSTSVKNHKIILNYNHTKDVLSTIRHTQVRVWSVYDPFNNRVTTYLWCPIPTVKKQLQTTSFHTLTDVDIFLSTYDLQVPQDVDLVTKLSFPSFSSQSYVVLHEPMLDMNTVHMFLSRVKTITGKEQSRVQTLLALQTETDIVLYCKQLLKTVFSIEEFGEFTLMHRKHTLLHNLKNCNVSFDSILTNLYDILEDATENKDHVHYQELMNVQLQDILLHNLKIKKTKIHHTLVFDDVEDFSFFPDNFFGFVRRINKNHSVLDYLIHDLSTTTTFTSVLTTTRTRHNEAFISLYEDKILPLFGHIQESDATHMTILKKYTFLSQLNTSCFPLRLHQLFNLLQPDETCPVFSLWNDDPVVKRQILRYTYHEGHHQSHSTLLKEYSKYVASSGGSMKLYTENPRHIAESIDIIIHSHGEYYLFTLLRNGDLAYMMKPFFTTEETPKNAPTYADQFVKSILPKINDLIKHINTLYYPTILPYNTKPSLLPLQLKLKNNILYCSQNTSLSYFIASHRDVIYENQLSQIVNALVVYLFPASFHTNSQITNIQKSIEKNGKHKIVKQYLTSVVEGRSTQDFPLQLLSKKMHFTFLTQKNFPRFATHLTDPVDSLLYLQKMVLFSEGNDVECTLIQSDNKLQQRNRKVMHLHPQLFCEFICLLNACKHSFAPNHNNKISSSFTSSSLCSIPYLSSESNVVLKNLEFIFRERYKEHITTALQSKSKYANACQRPKQPWCVVGSHVVNIRRWCRYACTTAEYDYWKVHSFREQLQLEQEPELYNGRFAPKYNAIQKTLTELAHNYCKFIRLTMCDTTHNLMKTTLTQLVRTVYETIEKRPVDTSNFSLKMILDNANSYQKYPHLLKTMVSILQQAYPTDDYNHDFEKLPAWAKVFYAVQRFAELLIYLRHPTQQTHTKEDIYYCSPLYVCTFCKAPIANSESPEYYYADPVNNIDIVQALTNAHKSYRHKPIVEASYRRNIHNQEYNYDYGDLHDVHMNELQWINVPPPSTTTSHDERNKNIGCPDRRTPKTSTSPYAEFGRLCLWTDLQQQQPMMIRIGQQSFTLSRDANNRNIVKMNRVDTSSTNLHQRQPTLLFVDAHNTYHLSLSSKNKLWKEVKRPPASCMCHLHMVSMQPVSSVIMSKVEWTDKEELIAICYKTETIILNRMEYTLILRFQQRRCVDALKTICIPTDVFRNHKYTIRLTLFGMPEFEKHRMQKMLNTRKTQKNKTKNGLSEKEKTRKKNTKESTKTVATYTASLDEYIKRKLVHIEHDETTQCYNVELDWHYCSSWQWSFPNERIFAMVVKLNQTRTLNVYARTNQEKREKAFPPSHFKIDTTRFSFTAFVNDDEWFRCPTCLQKNKYRTFRDKERSAYGWMVGIVKPDNNIKLDPNWLYACSFKKLGTRIDINAYAIKWKQNPLLSEYQYTIPLQQRTNIATYRAKTFNCSVHKVAQTDSYVLQSLHLQSFFEQNTTPVPTQDNEFVVSGTMTTSNKNELLRNHYGSLQQLWQCVIEEKITLKWLDSVSKYSILLNLQNGLFVHEHNCTQCAHDNTPWMKALKRTFSTTPVLCNSVGNAYLHLRKNMKNEKITDHFFHSVWEMMTQIGYKFGSQRRPIHYFFFSTIQMNGNNNNFESKVICPFAGMENYYWNPYMDDTKNKKNIDVMSDILLFCIGVKIQCKRNDKETFYLIRRQQFTPEKNPYVLVCLRSRVKHFCNHKPLTLKKALDMSVVGSTYPQENQQMLVNAYFYYKLYLQVQNCKLNIWSPTKHVVETYSSIHNQQVLESVIQHIDGHFKQQYSVHYITCNITNACVEVGDTHKLLCLPVQLKHCENMQYVNLVDYAQRFVSYSIAIQYLNRIAHIHDDYTPQVLQLNAVLEVTHVILKNNGFVPIQPISITAIRYNQFGLRYPSTYTSWKTQKQPFLSSISTPSFSSVIYWQDFQRVCEMVSSKFEEHTDTKDVSKMDALVHTIVQKCVPKERRKHISKEIQKIVGCKSSLLFTLISNHNIFALRTFLTGMFSSEYNENIFSFPTQHLETEYHSVYRKNTHNLFKTFLQKDEDESAPFVNNANNAIITQDFTQYVSEQYRLLPKPYSTYLPNTRVWNHHGLVELENTNNFSSHIHTYIDNKTFCNVSHIRLCLKKSIYILNEDKFLQPHDTKFSVNVDKSAVLLSRTYHFLCSATFHESKILHITHIPTFIYDYISTTGPLHIVIHNTTAHTAYTRKVYVVQKHSNHYEMKLDKTLSMSQTRVFVTLDLKKHRFLFYEILKHRVDTKMKNLLYEDISKVMHHIPYTNYNTDNDHVILS